MANYSDRLYEVHISDNNGINDEHFGIKEDSWIVEAIKFAKQDKSKLDTKRIFCLECHNASYDDTAKSLNLVNQIIVSTSNKLSFKNGIYTDRISQNWRRGSKSCL